VVIAALVPDLMDRSRISAALADVRYARTADECVGAEVVIVDLAKHADEVASVRRVAPHARVVAFGAHVDDALLAGAVDRGADVALARSQFFRDPARAVERDARAPE
jgi:hypothetical protein